MAETKVEFATALARDGLGERGAEQAREALTIFDELHDPEPLRRALAFTARGFALRAAGKLDEAKTWLTDGAESVAFVSSDAALLRFPAKLVRPQGLKGGGMAGMNLAAGAEAITFNVVDTTDPQHGEPMVVTSTGTQVKVTPFGSYPAKGRATGGVRVQRFLKGETSLDQGLYTVIITAEGLPPLRYQYPLRVQMINYGNIFRAAVGPLIGLLLLALLAYKLMKSKRVQRWRASRRP